MGLAANPVSVFREILAHEDDELWGWALDAMQSRLNADECRDLRVFALARSRRPIHQRVLIDALQGLPASAPVTEAVRAVYDRQETTRRVRVAAAKYLFRTTHEERYFEELRREALTPREDLNAYDDPPYAAMRALLEIAAGERSRRPQVTDIARTLLARIPRDSHPTWSQLAELVAHLGRWGGPRDAALLREYCEQSSVRVEAAYALAEIDPPPALAAARRHVADWIASERGASPPRYNNPYWNQVVEYSDLFVAFGDREVLDLYEEFLTQIAAHSEPGYELTYYRQRTESLLRVLRAKEASDQLAGAEEYLRAKARASPGRATTSFWRNWRTGLPRRREAGRRLKRDSRQQIRPGAIGGRQAERNNRSRGIRFRELTGRFSLAMLLPATGAKLSLSLARRIRMLQNHVPGARLTSEKLLSDVARAYEEVLESFPRSARHHNDLAWLLARCDRRLDDAFTHATRAVQLEPDKANYRDTLAEVHFRRGERATALDLAKRNLEAEPQNQHFQRQLRRFAEPSPP